MGPNKNIPKAKKYSENGSSSLSDDSTPILEKDPRKRPDVEISYFQFVGSEDIFLGMGTKDPGTSSSDGLKINILLQDETKLSDIEVDIVKDYVHLSTPRYILKEQLPRQVDPKTAKAKWNPVKHILELRCHVLPGEYDFLRH